MFYLLFLNQPDEIDQIFVRLLSHPSWNPHAKFLIRVNDLLPENGTEMLFGTIASYQTLDVIVVQYWRYPLKPRVEVRSNGNGLPIQK